MFKINWKNLALSEDDKKFLFSVAERLTHINEAGKRLVRYLISDADLEKRNDLIKAFQPNEEYKIGEEIFFNDGRVGKIEKVESGCNPRHGSFQIVLVSFGFNKVEFACAVDGATPLEYKKYSSLDDDELQVEVDEIFDKHGDSIRQAILKGIDNGSLDIVQFESQLLNKRSLKEIGEDKLLDLKEHLRGCANGHEIVPKSTEELLEYAFDDYASGEEKELRIFSLNYALNQYDDFHYLGAGRWMLLEEMPQISVQKRPSVPKIKSQIAEQMGIDDEIDYDEVELEAEDEQILEEYGERFEPEETIVDFENWRDMRLKIVKFPALTFQNRYEGFLPLTKETKRIFPPQEGTLVIKLFYGDPAENQYFQALVDSDDRTIKTAGDSFRTFFGLEIIEAGNYIYLEHLNSDTEYRISAKKLDSPKQVKCRFASIEDGKLIYEDRETPVIYESEEHRFRSEIRLEDLDALWKEAEEKGLSIFDCMYYAFPELMKTDPEGKGRVHYLDLFNAVFFNYRMCTLSAIQTELRSRPCFYQGEEDKGSGYWRFDPDRGVQIKLKRKAKAEAKPKRKKKNLPISKTETIREQEGSYSVEASLLEDGNFLYLLGLLVARGTLSRLYCQIELYQSPLEIEDMNGVDSKEALGFSMLQEVLSSFPRVTASIEESKSITRVTMNFEKNIELQSSIHSLFEGQTNYHNFRIPRQIFELPVNLKRNFMQGIADACGYVRRNQYYLDGRIFIFFQISNANWFLPTQLCHLLQDYLQVPVSFIVWGHPNIRDPKAKSKSESWAKEHQLKVFCDVFQDIGFRIPYKQIAFSKLVMINEDIGKPLPNFCNPSNKTKRTSHIEHPQESSSKLPDVLMRKHFDVWWEICQELNCPHRLSSMKRGGN